ncbi:MAG TPA: hypothetical protein ENG74_03770 [Thermoplasmatales archaeon]|nr:hypothetical protein [Thermoplasmatales archaeon]
MGEMGFDDYMRKFNEVSKPYVPPKKEWKPPDEILYGIKDVFRVPLKEAYKNRFKAIKYTFKHHYENNGFYRKFCKDNNVTPDDIKKEKDLLKIPLLPDKFFKNYPEGKDFATWLGNVYTGKLPRIVIREKNPTKDDIIRAFNNAGLKICFSSGTSGRHTFIPRDMRTFNRVRYGAAKAVITMGYPKWNYEELWGFMSLHTPNTNLFVGVMSELYLEMIKHVDYGTVIKKEITTDMIQAAMRGRRNFLLKIGAYILEKRREKKFIEWFKEMDKAGNKIAIVSLPYILYSIMEKLREEGLSFKFGAGSAIITGGGWKVREDKRITTEEFRKMVDDILGVPPESCLDIYGMVECNAFMVQCQEGHYLHIPYPYIYPLVLDKDGEPVDYGESGRFAFLDPLATSYPGFMISGDEVKILEHCPVCDRPGPVLDPEVRRAKGEEARGCAEEMRRLMAGELR